MTLITWFAINSQQSVAFLGTYAKQHIWYMCFFHVVKGEAIANVVMVKNTMAWHVDTYIAYGSMLVDGLNLFKICKGGSDYMV